MSEKGRVWKYGGNVDTDAIIPARYLNVSTPEATEAVCEKMMHGFGELMRKVSLEKVPTAILSRQTAGIRGQSLIVWAIAEGRAAAAGVDEYLMGDSRLPRPVAPTD